MTTTFGIDFGTSNSAVALGQGDGVRLANWSVPPTLAAITGGKLESQTVPTVLFAANEGAGLHVGYAAISEYLRSGLDGRFIQSIKSYLPQASFTNTVIRGRSFSIEAIVAELLRQIIDVAEKSLGTKIEGRIVLGRPTHYSLDPVEDKLAETRLRTAARMAGLGEVTLVIEPVAAALAYEAKLSSDETALVVDLGGGTSDFTLMRVGPKEQKRKDRRESILASGGLPSAGDCFDGEIVRARLWKSLGYGSNYQAFLKTTPVPDWIWRRLQRWNHVSFLKSKAHMDFLYEVRESSDQPKEIDALIQLIEEDMGYLLFRAVERAKREVATVGETLIADEERDLPVREPMTRAQFVEATGWLVEDIRKAALEVVTRGGLALEQVDAVFMTGGTSLVPEVRAAFVEVFGEAKLRRDSMFTSVVDGLARVAADD